MTLVASIQSDQDRLAILEAARTLAHQSGTRLTPIRQHVYEALLDSKQPLGAYDILETIDGVGAQKPPTVYRALDWLMDIGLAQRIATLSKYVAAPIDPDAGAVAYLLCRACGEAEAIDAGPFSETLRHMTEDQGFRDEETVIEITGLCQRNPTCRHARNAGDL